MLTETPFQAVGNITEVGCYVNYVIYVNNVFHRQPIQETLMVLVLWYAMRYWDAAELQPCMSSLHKGLP